MQMHRPHPRDMLALGAFEPQPGAVDGVDMLGPGVDQNDILPGPRQMSADIPADGPCPEDYNAFRHIGEPP
jgi:hypothetical protein